MGILQAGHPVLRAKAAPVPQRLFGTQALHNLIELMKTTMREAPGVGLAAPQIGIPLRVIVVEDTAALMRFLTPDEISQRQRTPLPFQAWINPVLQPLSDEVAEFHEGCLSVAGFEAQVKRHLRIELRGFDEHGDVKGPATMEGWAARIFQHEIDHLDGTLYVDRMDTRTLAFRGLREADALAALKDDLGLA
jgi:peptide deformylase